MMPGILLRAATGTTVTSTSTSTSTHATGTTVTNAHATVTSTANAISTQGLQLVHLSQMLACLFGDDADDTFDSVRRRPINLARFLIKVGGLQIKGTQTLQHKTAHPIHRTGSKTQRLRVH